MAYIGNKPTIGNFQICDAISVVNGQAAYTMQVGSVNVIPQSSSHMIVSLNGTIQKPGGTNPSFTVSGSTITFASNLVTNDVIDFIQILGDVLDLGVPSDATVTSAKLNNDIISGTTALTSEPADTDEFLVSDAGTLKRIDYSLIKGGGISQTDQFRVSASGTGDQNPISANLERVDNSGFGKIGSGMSVSSGVFTFPATGLYWINAFFSVSLSSAADSNMQVFIAGTVDNFSNRLALAFGEVSGDTSNNLRQMVSINTFFNCTNTSTHKVRFETNSFGSNTLEGHTDATKTGFSFIRMGDSV
jgi:hypothetical protein